MNYSSMCPTNCSVYPGEFVPLLNEEQVKAHFSLPREKENVQAPVNLKETEVAYEIEFALAIYANFYCDGNGFYAIHCAAIGLD